MLQGRKGGSCGRLRSSCTSVSWCWLEFVCQGRLMQHSRSCQKQSQPSHLALTNSKAQCMHADVLHAWCSVSVHNSTHPVINLDTRQCRKLNHSLTLCSRAALQFADMYLSGGTVKAGGRTSAGASSRIAPPSDSGTCAHMAESASLRGANRP